MLKLVRIPLLPVLRRKEVSPIHTEQTVIPLVTHKPIVKKNLSI
jgi:hypothetical protein